MDILKIYNTMKQIEMQSARTVKEQILEDNKGDKDFLTALDFLLNPFVVTGISTKKMKKKIKPKKGVEIPCIRTFPEMIEYLKENNSGRDLDVLAVKQYADQFESIGLYEFILKFVTKDLKLGISEKTVNKIYGKNTIPEFSVMLAESYEKKADKVEGKFYITQKLDGNRCVAIVEEDSVKFYTRKGQPIDGMIQLIEQFSKLPKGYVYDGELLLVNKDNLPSDELFRATQKVVRKDGEKKDLEFYVFDALPLSEFLDGKSKKTYEQRRNTLESPVISDVIHNSNNILLLPTLYEGNDISMIAVLSKFAEEQGWEGLMLNTAKGLYQTKRTTDLLKVKKMKTADLLCVSIEKAIDGQFEGLLARINVEYKGNLVGCGSGFTIEERRHFTDNPDEIINKIVEIQYFEESQDEKTGQPSLRFPVFKGVRFDKGLDDINYGE